MYLSSPARMRLALGPGRAVLILGPTVRGLVDMGSSKERSWFCGSLHCLLRDPRGQAKLAGLRPEETFHREDRKLVASEKAGTNLRRQHCQVTPRTAQLVQPASGQMRIGILEAHGTQLHFDYSLKSWAPEPLHSI